MRLGRALKDKLMDLRLRDKLVTEGKVSKKEVESYLKSLSDDEGNLTRIEVVSEKNGPDTDPESEEKF